MTTNATDAEIAKLREIVGRMTPGNYSARELAKTLEAGVRARPELRKFHDTTDYAADAAGIVALRNTAMPIIDAQAACIAELEGAAQAVIVQWDTPNWKLTENTAGIINRLRAALEGKAS